MISHVLLLLGLSFQTCSQLLVKNFRDCITVQLSRFCLPTSRQLYYISTACRFLSTSFLKTFSFAVSRDSFNRLTCYFLFVNMFFEKLFCPAAPPETYHGLLHFVFLCRFRRLCYLIRAFLFLQVLFSFYFVLL